MEKWERLPTWGDMTPRSCTVVPTGGVLRAQACAGQSGHVYRPALATGLWYGNLSDWTCLWTGAAHPAQGRAQSSCSNTFAE